MASTDRVAAGGPAFPIAESLVGAALFLVASISILLTWVPGVSSISLFWPGCAITAALLIRLPRVRWASAAVSIAVALLLANAVVARRPMDVSCLFSLVNLTEIALMVGVFRFAYPLPYPELSIEQAAIMTVIFGVAIPGVCAVGGGAAQTVFYGIPWLEATLNWWSSHTLGACLFGPPIVLFSRTRLKRLLRGHTRWQSMVALALSCAITALAIRYVRFPFVLVGFPLLIAAFRFGGFGTSVLALCNALTILILWGFGIKPFGLERVGSSGSLAGLPVIAVLASVMPAVAVGLGADARRALLRALRGSERHFRTALEHSPIGILVAELDGKWTYTNLALQKMLGYSAEEFRAMPPGGPSSDSEWKASQARWGKLLTGEIDYYDVERRFQHKDGGWIWAHVAVSLMRDPDGHPLRLIAQIESLEARVQAEERLAEEREKLKITLHSISDAVVTTDASAQVTYVNAAAVSLLGLTSESVEGRHINEIVSLRDPHSSRAAVSLVAKTMTSGKNFQREAPCELHRPDGGVYYVRDTVSPLVDAAGNQTGMVVVFRDATEDMARERELRRDALHDSLTGLYTRAEFQRQLRRTHERSRHLNRPAAVMAIDLDRFKALNDAAGHAAGDAMLCKVADALRATVRSADIVARLGGDEFALVLENCTAERAVSIAQLLSQALNPLEMKWEGTPYTTGASIGVATSPEGFATEQEWMRAADKACYAAKASGRGAVRIAEPVGGRAAIT
jgi:diguanylate cyclase (GGDEF)-like protein/PAS domain S-box-containing protein